MKTWTLRVAKARFSELLKASVIEGPQMVTLRGAETAVLVAVEEWRSLCERSPRSFKTLLLSPQGRGQFDIPQRGGLRRRPRKSGA